MWNWICHHQLVHQVMEEDYCEECQCRRHCWQCRKINTMGPSLSPAKQLHIICEISPLLDLPRTFVGVYFSSLVWCWKTYTCCWAESFWIADSSDYTILAHSSRVLCWCFLAHLRRASACLSVSKGRLTALHLRILSSWNRHRIVDSETDILTTLGNCTNGTRVLASAAAMIRLVWAAVVIHGRPGSGRLFGVCRVFRCEIKLDAVRRWIPVSREISAWDIDRIRPSILPLS